MEVADPKQRALAVMPSLSKFPPLPSQSPSGKINPARTAANGTAVGADSAAPGASGATGVGRVVDGGGPGFWELVRADIAGLVIERGRSRARYALEVALKILLYPRIQSVLLFRLSHACYMGRLPLVAYWLQGVNLRRSGAEIHPGARIGPGFCLVHSGGVVIGDCARIGAHFICFQNVTVGDAGRGEDEGQPVLGDWVTAGAGAKILGAIALGSGTTVGANAVLLQSTPPGAVAVGLPARIAKVRPLDDQGRPLTGF